MIVIHAPWNVDQICNQFKVRMELNALAAKPSIMLKIQTHVNQMYAAACTVKSLINVPNITPTVAKIKIATRMRMGAFNLARRRS